MYVVVHFVDRALEVKDVVDQEEVIWVVYPVKGKFGQLHTVTFKVNS